ncbi:MAG: hypothetical protein JOZ41_02475 [Chloroflexi bacterium]|nr:hypothetical protein [Chloroflexota bacterium]
MESELEGLRRRCEGWLRDLDLPSPFDVDAFLKSLERRRGRPIRLYALPMSRDVSGLWARGPTDDYIFYEERAAPVLQAHIKLHEACHIVCGHKPLVLSEAEESSLFFPDLLPQMVRRFLHRGSYSTVEEREAELLASLILERVGPPLVREAKPLDDETARVLAKHRAVFERR